MSEDMSLKKRKEIRKACKQKQKTHGQNKEKSVEEGKKSKATLIEAKQLGRLKHCREGFEN